MFDKRKWLVSEQKNENRKRLADALGVSPLCATLLCNRGYTEPEAARAFMEKSETFLYNPYLLKDMAPAVDRIKKALELDEKITIYGDYDVDGVTSVSILYMYLHDHGARVAYYIPTREGEGYGLSTAAFDSIAENGTKLVITVDTGITAFEEIEYAKSLGLDVVVTDHHECRPELPVCEAVVNPKRPDCEYPFKELSGVGVVFKILCALELDFINGGAYNLFTIKDMCRRYLDLVTIGTVADVMPLCDENRILVYMGLQLLPATHNIGIRALFRAIGIDLSKKVTASQIGYTVAPRINAAGRIGSAERAVQLFLAHSPQAADVIAEELCATNRERQLTENEIYQEAALQAEREADKSVLVLSGNAWHPGVIGIVASRITERYGKPSILISFAQIGNFSEPGDFGKGSARSVPGVNMVKALTHCESYLQKYGGHELAAGLSLKREDLEAFKECLNDYVSTHRCEDGDADKTRVETDIRFSDITMPTYEELSRLEPFGAQNPEPLYLIREVEIEELVLLSMGKHTRLALREGDLPMTGIFFTYNLIKEGFAVGDRVDLLCTLNLNEFRGTRTLQLVVRDMDYSDSFYREICETETAFSALCEDRASVHAEDVPARVDFVEVYRAILSLRKDGDQHLTALKLSALLPNISYLKTRIILEAFAECGILSVTTDGCRTAVTLLDVSEKQDVFATPIMQKLQAKTDKTV